LNILTEPACKADISRSNELDILTKERLKQRSTENPTVLVVL